jgi:hypothetical protein
MSSDGKLAPDVRWSSPFRRAYNPLVSFSLPAPRNPRLSTTHSLIILAAVVLAGLLLRMAPWFQDRELDLTSDAAYHERIVSTWLQAGVLPSPDLLSEPPSGRRLERVLPLGMYDTALAICRFAKVRDAPGVRLVLLWFTATAGALIALPVWLAARALWRDHAAALIAALVAAFVPAHVHRTLCYWVRYDALGTLLIATHLAFTLRALDEANSRRRLDAALSALTLAAALMVWRVALVVPLLEAAFVALWIPWRGASPTLREWLTIQVAAATVTTLVAGYLRAQGFGLSAAWLAVAGVTVVSWLPARGMRGALLMAAGIGLGVVLGLALARSSPYAGSVDLSWLKVRTLFHLGANAGPATGMTALLLQVEELYGLTTAGLLFGPQQFLALGVWLLAAPFLFVWLGTQPVRGSKTALTPATNSPARWLLAFLTVAFALLTLLMVRSKVVLAPLAAIVCGGLSTVLRSRGTPRARVATPALKSWLAILFALSVVATAVCGVMLGLSRTSRLDPGLATCLRWLKSNAAPGTIVLSSPFTGYEVQRYAGCASLTDGLLESGHNQEQILRSYSAWAAHGDSSLLDLCARNHVAYVLVPPPNELLYFGEVTGASFRSRLESQLPIETADLDRPIVRMMLGQMTGKFEQVAESGGHRLYRVLPSGP